MSQRGGKGGPGGRGRGGRGGGSGRGDFGTGSGAGDYGRGGGSVRGRGGDFGSMRGRGDHRGGHQRGAPIFLAGAPIPQPSAEVNALENQIVAAYTKKSEDVPSKSLANLSLKSVNETQLPMRPAYGTLGRGIVLRTNYYEVQLDKKQSLFQYSVDIPNAQKLSKYEKRIAVELLLKEPEFSSLNGLYASDWASNIITTRKVTANDGEEMVRKVFSLPVYVKGKPEILPLKVAKANSFTLNQFLQYLASPSPQLQYAAKEELIQSLNIIFSKIPDASAAIARIEANKHYPLPGHQLHKSAELGSALQAVRGYYSSVRTSTARVLVNVNVTTTAVYKAGPLPDIMREFFLGENSVDDLDRFLRKLKVEVSHLNDPNGQHRTKTIFRLARQGNDQPGESSKFRFSCDEKLKGVGKDGMISVRDYFQQKYSIRDPGAKGGRTPDAGTWVVDVGNGKEPQYLPPYVCKVVPGQAARRLLVGDQQKKMIEFACLAAPVSAAAIQGDGLRVLGFNQTPNAMSQLGIERVGLQMITVPGRILEGPAVLYKRKNANVKAGRWNLAGVQFQLGSNMSPWTSLFINETGKAPSFPGSPAELHGALRENLSSYGVILPAPHPPYSGGFTVALDLKDVAAVNSRLQSAFRDFDIAGIRFVFVILPRKHAFLYARIKFSADILFGIHTVDMVGTKMYRAKRDFPPEMDRQYLANIALKVNLKLGGVNHQVDSAKLSPLDSKTMLVGIDVTHPSPGSKETAPSVASVVASIDLKLAQWPASLRLQVGTQEMVGGDSQLLLKEMIKERLVMWQQKNGGALPNKLLVYRDGVSEGQYKTVLTVELPQIVGACKEVYPIKGGNLPKVTIIVVGKRHHTRFYPTKEEDSDGTTQGNPQNGTLVDRGITMERGWDFFLQAHTGLKGTARPAHYVVIHDEIGFKADQLQALTHNLCYLFGRATTAVSICPPAYYADKVCDRARFYLQEDYRDDISGSGKGTPSAERLALANGIHKRLKDTMFYI